MPSRLGVGSILLFWLATAGLVVHREVVPRLFAGGPPPIAVDLADEATQQLPTRWTVYRGDKRVGSLTTQMKSDAEGDSFRFFNTYRELSADFTTAFGSVTIFITQLETVVRVTRAGELREQRTFGDLEARVPVPGLPGEKLTMATASAEVSGVVRDGQLTGDCKLWFPARPKQGPAPPPAFDRPLDPVPVAGGQVLNPMMPVNRLRDVRPGRRWVIREANPLQEALDGMVRGLAQDHKLLAGMLPTRQNRELLAEVRSAPERLERDGLEPADCWVIDYRGEDARASTWVSVADGRVLRQEATGFGERLRFERED